MLVERMSLISQAPSQNACNRVYRQHARGLERLLEHRAARVNGGGEAGYFVRVVGVGRIAGLLESAGECVNITARVERRGVARVIAQNRNIILEAGCVTVIRPEFSGDTDSIAVLVLLRSGGD